MNYHELSTCDKSSLLQLFYIEQLEILTKLDDFYKKQMTGIKVMLPLGIKTNIIPELEKKEIQNRVLNEVRLKRK